MADIGKIDDELKIDKIIVALKNARKAQGLSQVELSERVGVPQSHISKIENGNVDIQLSSLIQIARALDFELQLVPKKALPAVQSIIRSTMPEDYILKAVLNAKEMIADKEKFKNSLAGAVYSTTKQVTTPRPAYSLDDEDE